VPQETANQQLVEIMARIAALPGGDLEPPQFFANFLQLTIAATGARAGAVWVIQPQGPQCYCHADLQACNIDDPQQQRLVVEAVNRAVQEGKTFVVPAAGSLDDATRNQCSFPLFFKPLKAAQKIAMVIQIVAPEQLTEKGFSVLAALLNQAGESAQTYLAHRRAIVLEDDRKSLTALLQYAQAVHNSLDPEKVVYQVANLGRDVLRCDRVVLWIDPKVKRNLRAVSGIDKPDRRAVLLRSVEKLAQHCLKIAKPVIASRQQLAELPDEQPLTILLKEYFNVSQLDQIYLQPIKKEEQYLGVLIAEGFDDQSAANLAGVIAAVANHGAMAIANAIEMDSVPVIRSLARWNKFKKDPQKKRRWQIKAVVCVLALLLLMLIPWPIRINCACELAPENIRQIGSPLDKVKITSIVQPSGIVQQGQTIVLLDDLDLQTELHSLQQKLKQENINQRSKTSETDRQISELEIARLEGQIDFFRRQIEKCNVTAPIAGTILTDQLDRKQGLTVSKGDLICEVAAFDKWQLRLDVPQEEIDWVQRCLLTPEDSTDKQSDTGAEVKFFLAAYPQFKLTARIDGIGQVSQMARIKDRGNVFEIRVSVSPDQLKQIERGLRNGMVGRAKIETVDRPLGFVLLRKVIRFFRVTFF
jgi:hypothetical protein